MHLQLSCGYKHKYANIKLWSERENQQDATVRCLLSTLSQHVSGIIMPIFRRTKTVCYCMWCAALVPLDVVGSGCGALRCKVRALWRLLFDSRTVTFTVLAPYNAVPHNCYQPHPAEPAQHTTCSNTSWSPEDGHNNARNMLRKCW